MGQKGSEWVELIIDHHRFSSHALATIMRMPLPTPVTFNKSNSFKRNILYNVLNVLFSHIRILSFCILLLFCISLLLNAFYIKSRIHHQNFHSSSLFATITRHATTRGLNHLILVPGHAIWKGGDPRLRLDDDQWILEPYQKAGGRVDAFFAHIQRG